MKPDPPAIKERRESAESAARKARMAKQELLACKVCPVHREFMARLVPMEPRVPMAPRGLLADLAEMEPRVPRNVSPRAFGSRAGRIAPWCKMERTANRV